jgi:hypothetical protein
VKRKYDIISSVPVYKSASKAERYFLHGLKQLECNVLGMVVTFIDEDTNALIPIVESTTGADVALFKCDVNSTVYAWGLAPLWCLHNKIDFRYNTQIMDGDEFIEGVSNTTIHLLDQAYKKSDFVICSFNYVDNTYNGWGEQCIDGHLEINPEWVDAHYFVRKEDILKYGIVDGPSDFPNPFFTDMEYIHRARHLSGRPLVVDTTHSGAVHQWVFHHRREDLDVVAIRNENSIPRITAGSEFWIRKYGIPKNIQYNCNKGAGEWPRIFDIVRQPQYVEKMKGHFAYNNLWLDFEGMYQFVSPKFHLITSNCSMEE